MKTLRQAAQALCDRWDTPLWKDVAPTAVFIGELRAAIKREEAQAVELLVCDKCGIDTPDPWHSSENGSKHYHRCDVCHAQAVEAPLFEAGELGLLNELLNCEHPALFTHQTPATGPVKPPENCGTGYCSCVECVKPAKPSAGERASHINALRESARMLETGCEKGWLVDELDKAADMLAADALEIEELESDYTDQVLRAMKAEEALAQQVAVPQEKQ